MDTSFSVSGVPCGGGVGRVPIASSSAAQMLLELLPFVTTTYPVVDSLCTDSHTFFAEITCNLLR